MNIGDLVKVIKNDMSLVIKNPGPKDNKFFNKIGTVLSIKNTRIFKWVAVSFESGVYHAREDALEVINVK